jgi:hypothetical protein
MLSVREKGWQFDPVGALVKFIAPDFSRQTYIDAQAAEDDKVRIMTMKRTSRSKPPRRERPAIFGTARRQARAAEKLRS